MSTLDLSHLSHRARRAYLKKLKRKKQRQARAQLAEKLELEELSRLEASPSYQLRLKEEEERLQLEKEQNEQAARDWLNREIAAQEQWREEQRKKAELQHREEELRLRNREERARVQLEKAPQPEPTNYLIQPSESTGPTDLPPWHHPPPPVNEHQPPPVPVTNVCGFFRKTGACRYGINCSRLHDYPQRGETNRSGDTEDCLSDNSCVVLCVPQMFTHYHLPPADSRIGELEDPDSFLEVDETQLYADYEDFYVDVRDELESRWGRISALRTCRNRAEHLRGSVYVEFALGAGAAWDAADALTGRWFAGRQLTCTVVRFGGGWREAVCGLDHRGKCPKGTLKCNFLHVFLNPGETAHDLLHALRSQRGALPPPSEHPLRRSTHWSPNSSHHSWNSPARYHGHRLKRRRIPRSSSSERSSERMRPIRCNERSRSPSPIDTSDDSSGRHRCTGRHSRHRRSRAQRSRSRTPTRRHKKHKRHRKHHRSSIPGSPPHSPSAVELVADLAQA